MKMEQREYSEMSAYKIQTTGNYPEENIQQYENYSQRKMMGRDGLDSTTAEHRPLLRLCEQSNELLVHKQSRKFLELSNYHLLEE